MERGIYKIDCGCGKTYIGVTERNLAQKMKEHTYAVRCSDYDRSALAYNKTKECNEEI